MATCVPHEAAMELAAMQTAAYAGRFAEAREAHARALALCREPVARRALVMHLGMVELLAGEPAAAEAALRDGFDALGALGEVEYRATVGALLALSLVRLERWYEALELLEVVDELAATDDADAQVRVRIARALALTGLGEPGRAVPVARQAVALAARTDDVVLHGDSLSALGEVWLAAGEREQARLTLREALELYEQGESAAHVRLAEDLLGAAA